MTENEIFEKVQDIVVEQLGIDKEAVSPGASFIEDLGADSLDTSELIMTIEEQFDIDISDEDAKKIECVKDVVKFIRINT